ncbi:F0F1 ATP synthase subunit B [Crocinitomicaceae bacterium]|jgi:F-type H+-transporting ATPase subunit b|nr:F0F1 ATP synthase subunit B [Crocinitomicaceae bacterium]
METLLNDFSLGLFVMQTVILAILILLMRKFAWKPILKALDLREEGIESAINMAEEARKEIAELKSSNENLLKEARVERDNIIKEAKELATKMVDDSKATAKIEAEKVMTSAREAINNEKVAALSEIKTQIAEFSIQIAEKVVGVELASDEKQKALSEKLASDFNLN